MSSRINLNLSPSGSAGLLATVPWFALAAFSVAAALESSPLLLAGLIPACGMGWHSFRRYGLLQTPNAIVSLQSDGNGLTCSLTNGDEIPVTVCGSSYLSPTLVILKLRPKEPVSGSMITLMTGNAGPFRGNASEPDFRRLRMQLRTRHSANPY